MTEGISTPGLTVSARTHLTRRRVLPIKGKVLVAPGQEVDARDPVARAELPGALQPVNAAAMLGVPAKELKASMRVKEGDPVEKDQLLAESSSFFGAFKNAVRSPVRGTVESISALTGQVMLRAAPRPLDLLAYVPGQVVEVIEDLGAVIRSEAVLVQGIFGMGPEAYGTLKAVCTEPGETLGADRITREHRDAVLLARGSIDLEALRKMREIGVRGAVAACADGQDLMEIAGRELNIAATGEEDLGFTLVLTEGFGNLAMSPHTFDLLMSLDNTRVSINGATQIRAGVIRPELIAPLRDRQGGVPVDRAPAEPKVRIVRGDSFGSIGRITAAPEQPRPIGSGATALVFEVTLDDGRLVTVPRSNVEALQSEPD